MKDVFISLHLEESKSGIVHIFCNDKYDNFDPLTFTLPRIKLLHEFLHVK